MDADELAMQIQFQLYREREGDVMDDDDDDDDDEGHEEEDDDVPPMTSESLVHDELEDLMRAMKFRVYYDDDDPRGELGRTKWDDDDDDEDEETKEQFDREKKENMERAKQKPIYRLIKAIQRQDELDVQEILESTDVSVNEEMQFHTPLGMAVFVQSESLVQLLLDRGANPNGLCATTDCIMEQHPLMISVQKRDYEVARLLLLKGAKPNWQDTARMFPLMESVNIRDVEMTMLLLNHGANPNLSDYHRSTPLHRACVRETPELVELLLMFGAKTDVFDSHGLAPIHKACQLPSSACLEHLVRFGADLELETINGETPLVWTARQANADNLEASGFLVEAGANLYHCPAGTDMTPLRSAWQRRKVNTVVQFLLAGIDVTKEEWVRLNNPNADERFIWHRDLYLTILNFKPEVHSLRHLSRDTIRRRLKENMKTTTTTTTTSITTMVEKMEVWPFVKDFLLLKDLPRTSKGIDAAIKSETKLKLLNYGDEYV